MHRRMPAAETRRRNDWPRTSEISVTSLRFGRKRRFVLLFAWLTLWPLIGPLPVSSQTRDMCVILRIKVERGAREAPRNSVRVALRTNAAPVKRFIAAVRVAGRVARGQRAEAAVAMTAKPSESAPMPNTVQCTAWVSFSFVTMRMAASFIFGLLRDLVTRTFDRLMNRL